MFNITVKQLYTNYLHQLQYESMYNVMAVSDWFFTIHNIMFFSNRKRPQNHCHLFKLFKEFPNIAFKSSQIIDYNLTK